MAGAEVTGSRAPAAGAWLYLAGGLVMAAAMLPLRDTPLVGVPPVATTAVTIGLSLRLRHRDPRGTMPWGLCGAVFAAFLLGGALRQALAGTRFSLLADAVTLLGYAGWLTAFLRLLRLRQARARGAHELVDALIVLVASACLVVVLVVLPTIERTGLTPFAVLQVSYPLLDVLIGFVVLLLGHTSLQRTPAFWLLAASVLAALVGDIGYGRIATEGATVGSPLLDLPYVLGFAAFGAAALHPTMTRLAPPAPRPVREWSGGRLVLLVPGLLTGPVLVLADPSRPAAWAGSIASASVSGLLMWRAVGAVRALGRSQELLHHRATHDSLTGLANRTELMSRLEQMLAAAAEEDARVHLLFLDVDGFKLVNDTYGHHTGDRVLNAAAARLRDLAGPRDVVARLGGDEFVLACLVGPGDRAGHQVAAAVVEAFQEPLPAREGSFVATVSIGLAVSDGRTTADLLLREADAAMYRAKRLGKNRVVAASA